MTKFFWNSVLAVAIVFGLSSGVMAQSGDNNDNKRPPKNEKKDPPKIPVRPKNDRPKEDKNKPKKPPMESAGIVLFVREDR